MRIVSLVALIGLAATGTPAVANPRPSGPSQPAPPAPAPATEADRLAAEAAALAAAGDLRGAAARFRAAHAVDPRADLLCNVGVAFYKAQDLPRAHLYLGQCLTRAGSLAAAFAAAVRTAFATTEDRLRAGEFAPINVAVVPDGAAVTVSAFDPEDAIVGARLIWLPFGHHQVTAQAEGHRAQTVAIDIAGRDRQPIRIALERTPAPPDPVEPAPAQAAPRRPPNRRPALIATTATGVVAVGGLAAYLLARSAASAAGEAGISATTYDDRVASARFRQHLAWGLGGAAAVGAVASGWLWYRATRSTARSVAVAVNVAGGGDGAHLALFGRF